MYIDITEIIFVILFLAMVINIFIIIKKNKKYKKIYLKNSENYINKLCIEFLILVSYLENVYVSIKGYSHDVRFISCLILAMICGLKFILIKLSK